MSIPQFIKQKFTFNKALEITVLVYQVIAVIAFIIIPVVAFQWWKTPFIGAFVEQTMVFNGVGPIREGTENEAWELFLSGVTLGDQLKEIDGKSISSAGDIQEILSAYQFNDEIQVTYQREEGSKSNKNLNLIPFPTTDKIKYFAIPYGIGIVFLLLGLWMARLRISESAGRAFILFATSFSIGSAALFDLYTTHHLTILWTFSVGFAGGALLDLALTFPQEFSFTQKYPIIRRIGYIIALILGLLALPDIYNLQSPTNYIQKWQF
ncbi:MAG: hypothetical protein HQ525_03155, partial [Anaerolineae bacterium]|nr:hypothetical protein [Anaerolineae bacterium]